MTPTPQVPISPLWLNQLTGDTWGLYDAVPIAQLGQFANDPCYRIRMYSAPDNPNEVLAPGGYVQYGMRVLPGSLIYGIYLPAVVNVANSTLSVPPSFTLQVRDIDLGLRLWDDPIASLFASNFKPTFQSNVNTNMGSFVHLLPRPRPVCGTGMFEVEIQETGGITQRIQVVFGVLEVCRNVK